MKKIITIVVLTALSLIAQNRWFSMPSFWEVGGPGMAFNIEAFDMNKDGHLDVVLGNWNDTYVYYGGYGILDETVDVTYTGRMLAVCDYNGDGFDDLIAMHLTQYDSSRYDYDGEILFYWGNDTTEIAIDTIADYSIPLPTQYPTIEYFTFGRYTVGIQKGDLNGDGKIDLVLSSAEYGLGKGNIYIYMGKETPADIADFILIGQNYSAFIGDFVQVGNINGDSYDDFLFSSNQSRTVGVSYDSLNYLHIFFGSEKFSAIQGNESELHSSFVSPPDSIAGWFLRRFSVDDINADGIDDIIVGRSFYDYPHITTVHYGSVNGIDTIPSFTFIQDTTNPFFFSAGGVTQNIGDYNMDGYDDFIMSPAGYQQFALHFGTPYPNNINRYGARGYSNSSGVFPQKGVNMGDQTNDSVNDIAVISSAGSTINNGYVLMLYGQDIPTEVKDESSVLPQEFNLFQNYPNPFNPKTIIGWQLSVSGNVKIRVYDSLGKEVAVLLNEVRLPGKYEIEFDAEKYKLSSGTYFYKLKTESATGGGEVTRKMLFLK